MANKLFSQKLKVVNLGLQSFADTVKSCGADVVHVNFKPPASGDEKIISALTLLSNPSVEEANKKAFEKIVSAQPVLVDILPAGKVVPGMTKDTVLHAGPPVTWDRMCGPVRGAITGALIYEGLAKDNKSAEKLAASGKIRFAPCHHHSSVGPMAGILSYSMYVFVIKNETSGNYAYCSMNEGLGKVLRFGANSADVIQRLKWMQNILGPALGKGVRKSGGINIKNITAQALMMGDECHNRNVAATNLFIKEMIPHLLTSGLKASIVKDIITFISGNPHFYLNISMAACKATCDTIAGIKNSTVVYTMARNGTDIGIRVAGMPDVWFTAPSGNPKGLYFSGFSEKDANPDLGDSTISETAGIGANAMAAAPAIVKFVGGSPIDSINYTKKMYKITVGRHSSFQIPQLDFAGSPVCFDIRKIMEKGITPVINTGIAHKLPGVGQVGAGILDAPIKCFRDSVLKFAEILGGRK